MATVLFQSIRFKFVSPIIKKTCGLVVENFGSRDVFFDENCCACCSFNAFNLHTTLTVEISSFYSFMEELLIDS